MTKVLTWCVCGICKIQHDCLANASKLGNHVQVLVQGRFFSHFPRYPTIPVPATSMSSAAVELHGVSKKFGNFQAVHPMDLTVPAGSIYGFIGPNGSGKTTTMRMILRIYQPDSGSVSVLGSDHGTCADDRVGYLPEERGLYRRMTVRRVLRYFAKIKGMRSPDESIERWLAAWGQGIGTRSESTNFPKGWLKRFNSSAPSSRTRNC